MKYLITLFACCLFLFSCKSDSKKNEEPVNEFSDEYMQESGAGEASDSTAIEIEPVSHATAVINWGDKTIYLDPTGGAEAFEGRDEADFVLITDIHGDHLNAETLAALELGNKTIIVPEAVKQQLPDSLAQHLVVINNGETMEEQGFSIEAIPMYNLREEAKQFHEKGRGNGYVLEKDGSRLYIAGDTEDIPEMRNLQDIDIALVPMNLPYTMNIESAADAVIEFAPRKVYPYHYRGTDGMADVEKFKQLVNEGNPEVEVVLADWYPDAQGN